MSRRRATADRRVDARRRALLGVLSVLTVVGLIGMHGLAMSVAPTSSSSSSAMPGHLAMHHGAAGSHASASPSPVALIAPRGCGADHGSCVAAVRAQAHLHAPAEVASIAASSDPEAPRDQVRWVAAARGPPGRPPALDALGISRT